MTNVSPRVLPEGEARVHFLVCCDEGVSRVDSLCSMMHRAILDQANKQMLIRLET